MTMNNKFSALQDEDSGEENSYKDADEEVNREVKPGPGEHPLQYSYCFWYSKRPQGRPADPNAFEKNIRVVSTISSVEQFWKAYSHMKRPGDLNGHCDIHLFKQGIKPLWEDEANKDGGKWIVRIRKHFTSRSWENLIMAMVGEQFMVGDEICGAVVSLRFQEDIISIWNKTANNTQATVRIRDTLRRVLNLPPSIMMEYKKHGQSMRDKTSFRNTEVFHSHR